MGTNYSWHKGEPCKACGRPHEGKHIGKSSGGWCFALHVYQEEGITDLADWQRLWHQEGSYIENEYGERIDPARMLTIIIDRQWERKGVTNAEWYSDNHAQAGPKGLARSKVDGHHCVGHGQGTWDLMAGEFS